MTANDRNSQAARSKPSFALEAGRSTRMTKSMEALPPQAMGALWRAVAKVLRRERAGAWTSLEALHGALLCAQRLELRLQHVEAVVRAGGRNYELRSMPAGLEARAATAPEQGRSLRRALTAVLRYSLPGWRTAAAVTRACAVKLGRSVSLERALEALRQDPQRFEVAEWEGDVWARAKYKYNAGRRVAAGSS